MHFLHAEFANGAITSTDYYYYHFTLCEDRIVNGSEWSVSRAPHAHRKSSTQYNYNYLQLFLCSSFRSYRLKQAIEFHFQTVIPVAFVVSSLSFATVNFAERRSFFFCFHLLSYLWKTDEKHQRIKHERKGRKENTNAPK